MTVRVDERRIDDPGLVMDRGCATNPVRKRLRGEGTDEDEREYVAALKRHGEAKRCLTGRESQAFRSVTMPEGAAPLAVTELDPPEELAESEVRRLGTLNEFLAFYIEERPHISLDWDNLVTPAEAFDKLLPSPEEDLEDSHATEVSTDE